MPMRIINITKTPGTDADWELSNPPFGMPDLESVIGHAERSYRTPRERPNEDLDIDVRNVPCDISDMIWYMREKGQLIKTRSFAEGCLIRCGLRVIENLFKEGSRSREARKNAIQSDNLDERARYTGQELTPIHLGSMKVTEMRVSCLSEDEKIRITELSHTYGLSIGVVTIYAMAAGIAQSVGLLPKVFRERAEKEIGHFRKRVSSQ